MSSFLPLPLSSSSASSSSSSSSISSSLPSYTYERSLIRSAFSLFDRDGHGMIPKEEVGTIMRYLRAYPTEEQLISQIIPMLQEEDESSTSQQQLNQTKGKGGKGGVQDVSSSNSSTNLATNSGMIKWSRFESFMLRVWLEREYEPDSEETLLQAFRTLDVEGKGYLDESTLMELLSENEWALRDKEMEDFLRVAKDPDTNFIHYEDYVALMDS